MGLKNNAIVSFDNVSLLLDTEKNLSTGEIIRNFFASHAKKKEMRNNNKSLLLDSFTFEAFEGDVIGLTGPNGSGKSSLLRTIAGVYQADQGKITINGRVSSVIDLGAGIDYTLTGVENVVRLGLMRGFQKPTLVEQINEIIDFSGLGDAIYQPVRVYSSGMVLRLMFSVATHFKPDILLIDEMFGVGDEEFQIKAQERMKKLISDASLVFFASHSDALIKNICNRQFVIENGRLLSDVRL